MWSTEWCRQYVNMKPYNSMGKYPPQLFQYYNNISLLTSHACTHTNYSNILVQWYLIGWRSNIGGCISASSIAVIPTAHISHYVCISPLTTIITNENSPNYCIHPSSLLPLLLVPSCVHTGDHVTSCDPLIHSPVRCTNERFSLH